MGKDMGPAGNISSAATAKEDQNNQQQQQRHRHQQQQQQQLASLGVGRAELNFIADALDTDDPEDADILLREVYMMYYSIASCGSVALRS